MKCPYVEIECAYLDTAGMNKPVECKDCTHYKEPDEKGIIATGATPVLAWIVEKIRGIKENIQFVRWPDWHGFHFIKGDPLKTPAAFHLIYKWDLWLGWIEIRMFLSDTKRIEAFNIYETKNSQMDHCIKCNKVTIYSKDTHVSQREYYVEGAGQLCPECWNKIYNL
jgi:hypothetical protein